MSCFFVPIGGEYLDAMEKFDGRWGILSSLTTRANNGRCIDHTPKVNIGGRREATKS